MKIVAMSLVLLFWATQSMAAGSGRKLEDLLGSGWQPFSAHLADSYPFTVEGRTTKQPAYTVFLYKKGGLAFCARSVFGSNPSYCDMIKQGSD